MTRRRLAVLLVTASGALVPWLARAERPAPSARVYRACPSGMTWSEPAGACVCAGALRWDRTAKRCTAACPPGKMQAAGAAPGTCAWLPRTCAPGRRWSEKHDGCVVVCPRGKAANAAGTGCVADPHGCPEGTQWYESRSACLPFCAPGRSLDYAKGTCVDDEPVASEPVTPPSARRPPPEAATRPPPKREPAKPGSKGAERPRRTPTPCPDGEEWLDAFEACVPICAPGEVLDFYGIGCHPIRGRRDRPARR